MKTVALENLTSGPDRVPPSSFALASAILALAMPLTCFQARGQEATNAAFGEKVFYYDGETRIETVLALNELRLELEPGLAIDEAQFRQASPEVTTVTNGVEGSHVSWIEVTPAADKSALVSKAQSILVQVGAGMVLPVLYPLPEKLGVKESRQVVTRRIAIKPLPDVDIVDLATRYNLTVLHSVDYSPNTYILRVNDPGLLAAIDAANTIFEREGVEFAVPIVAKPYEKKLVPNDFYFGPNQWHLRNFAQYTPDTVAGNDVNIESAWNTHRGEGITIGIVDDGVDWWHPDITNHYRIDIDTNFVTDSGYYYDPTEAAPKTCSQTHGTACAGCAAGHGNNSIGIAGAAYEATLVGIRLLPPVGGLAPPDQIASALNHLVNPPNEADRIHIKSNSWGPLDHTSEGQFQPIGALPGAALLNGISNGRGGKGIIFVWAHGNGHCSGDYGNADAYASSQYTIAVAATTANGTRAFYSEKGAAITINAPSSGNLVGCGNPTTLDIFTTGMSDHHRNTYCSSFMPPLYDSDFGGTSAATPIAAGCIALVLQANPNLTWRDVQHLLIKTATRNDYYGVGWNQNAAGLNYNHSYGFGRINASAAVSAAPTWNLVPSRRDPIIQYENFTANIPDYDPQAPVEVTRTISITAPVNLVVEHVEITTTITHPKVTDLRIRLISPSGTESILNEPNGYTKANLNGWIFTTVVNWGEPANGIWSLKLADQIQNSQLGQLESWIIRIYGYTKYAINCGGTTASPFSADIYHAGGYTYSVGSQVPIDTSQVINPAPTDVYRSARLSHLDSVSNPFSYIVPELKVGQTYKVRLHFCENYFTQYGQQIFDVKINGTFVLQNFDIMSGPHANGMNKAYIAEFTNILPNASKQIVIEVVPRVAPLTGLYSATLNGIEVIPQ